jgi:hypothetical protein
LQIPCRLHLCDEADSILDTIYGHLENEHLLSMNSSWETTFLDVIIPILGLQLKYAINIATCWMMFEINNKVLNVGRSKFTKLVLDVLQLLTLEKLHYAITKIIHQIICQKDLTSIKGNSKDLCIRHVINLFSNQPSSLLDQLSTLTSRKPFFFNQKFSTTWHLQLCFNWDFLPIKLTCLLYWYIIESIFQLDGHLLNILSINKSPS